MQYTCGLESFFAIILHTVRRGGGGGGGGVGVLTFEALWYSIFYKLKQFYLLTRINSFNQIFESLKFDKFRAAITIGFDVKN